MKKNLIITFIAIFFLSMTAFAQNDANAGKKDKSNTELPVGIRIRKLITNGFRPFINVVNR